MKLSDDTKELVHHVILGKCKHIQNNMYVICIKLLSCLTLTSAIRNSTLKQKHFTNHFHFMKSLMTTKKGLKCDNFFGYKKNNKILFTNKNHYR